MTTIKPTAPGIAPGAQLLNEDTALECATDEIRASSRAEYARPGLTRTNPDLPHQDAIVAQTGRTANDSRGIATAPESAPNLQTRAAELIAAGYRPVPVKEKRPAYAGDTSERDYAPEHFIDGMRIQVRAGLQKDGGYLYGYDLEGPSHGPAFDADREWAALEQALPHVARKLVRVRSTTGDGWWLLFRCHKTLHSGTLFQDGRKIGDFIGNGGTQRVPDFGKSALQTLTLTEIQHLLDFWTVRNAVLDGESWTMRGRQGASYAAGYKRVRATKTELRDFLIALDTKTSLRLADKLTTAVKGERSTLAGNLMQCLMFNVHKLTKTTDFSTNCRAAMAYWMVADSFGKADEKDYTQEKDGYSLVSQIIHEDPLLCGGSWTCPFWAKSHATTAPVPTPAPEPTRPAHRPAGDRAKQIVRFKRLLKHRWEDETTGRFYYFVDDLDDWAARCGVSRRSIQSYLTELEAGEQIERGQEGGRGGRPWMLIKPAFFGMQITPETAPKAVPETDKIGAFGDADQIADERILTPQSVESPSVCIVDHQNTCAPTHQPPRAPLSLEDLVARDMAIMQALYADLRPLTPEERANGTKPKQKRFIPRKEQRLDLRYSAAKPHGELPKPTPAATYRPPRSPLPLEDLPEPPAAAAPAGAHGAGAPLPAPAGASPAQLMAERRRRRDAQREAIHVE